MEGMRYFFCDEIQGAGQVVSLSGKEFEHIVLVNRLKKGDFCCLINGKGVLADAKVQEIGKKRVLLELTRVQSLEASKEKTGITLAVALSRKGSFQDIVIKAVELGVERLVPLITERTVVVVDDASKFIEKYQLISREAMKQCHRLHDLEICSPIPLNGLCSLLDAAGTKVFLHPYGGKSPREILGQSFPELLKSEIVLALGPEGGFTDDEVLNLEQWGFSRMSLAGHILRLETAVIAGLSLVRFR